jgi:hypothetical protein
MRQLVYNVYHYRGKLQNTFLSEDEARDFCNAQKLPQEFYWEVDAREYESEYNSEFTNAGPDGE